MTVKKKDLTAQEILEKYTNTSIHNVPNENDLVIDTDEHVKLAKNVKTNTFEKL